MHGHHRHSVQRRENRDAAKVEPGWAGLPMMAIARITGRRVSIPPLWLGATLLRVKSSQAECKYSEKAAKSRRDMQALQLFRVMEGSGRGDARLDMNHAQIKALQCYELQRRAETDYRMILQGYSQWVQLCKGRVGLIHRRHAGSCGWTTGPFSRTLEGASSLSAFIAVEKNRRLSSK